MSTILQSLGVSQLADAYTLIDTNQLLTLSDAPDAQQRVLLITNGPLAGAGHTKPHQAFASIGNDKLRLLHLCVLSPASDGSTRAVCSGWADAAVQDLLARADAQIWYAGGRRETAGLIHALEQSTCAVQTALAAEALALGVSAGVEGARLYSAIAGAAGSSWSFRHLVPKMLGQKATAAATVEEQSTDAAIQALSKTIALANGQTISTPLAALSAQLYRTALRFRAGTTPSSSIYRDFHAPPSARPAANGVHGDDAPSVPPGKVGLIGLGAMGYGMANVLRRQGTNVVGFDAWTPSANRYHDAGGQVAESIVACATNADVLILMVVNAQQVEDVLFKHDAASALPEHAVVLIMCTVSPSQITHLATRLAAHRPDVHIVDAPVSGGTPRAASGDLTILCAGLEHAGPRAGAALHVLETLSGQLGNGDNLVHVPGGVGKGSTVKLINQHLAGCHIISVAETLAIAAGLGLPLRLVREIILSGPASSWMMGHRGQNMLDRLIQPPTSMIDIFVKDMSIVTGEAALLGAPVPLASQVEQLFVSGKARGWGRDDDSSIIRLWGQDIIGPDV